MVNIYEASNIAKTNILLDRDELVDDNCSFLCYLIEYIPTDTGSRPSDPNNLCFFMGNSSRILAKVGIVELKPTGRI